jgi:HEAT repeat protein
VRSTGLALIVASVLAMVGILPAIFVLGREKLRRGAAGRAIERVKQARDLVGGAEDDRLEEVARALAQFDAVTVERTVEALLGERDGRIAEWARRLFAKLGLLERYATILRSASSWSERLHAAEVLGRVASAGSMPMLVETLRDAYEDQSVKAAAADALASIREPEVIPLLIDELLRVDEHATPRIAEALVGFGKLVTSGLVGLLEHHEHQAARVWAARILGSVGDAAAVDVLSAGLRDRHDLLRIAAAEALGAIGEGRALQPLVQAALRDPAPQVRAHAAGAVAKIAGERAVDVLVAALSDPDYATRIRALEAFENIRLSDTSPLEQALGDMNAEVRRRAALALERVGYFERIVEQLGADDRKVAKRAYAVLLELGSAGLADSIAAQMQHPSLAVRAHIARACGELGVARVGPILIAALDDRDWPVRAALCEAIGLLRVEGGARAMAQLLTDPEESVREAATHALEAYTTPEIEPFRGAIVAAYQGGSIPVRLSMVAIAGRIEDPELAQMLVQATHDPSEAVRLRAVKSLAGRSDELAVAPLIACITDSSVEVRMAAASGLGAATTADALEALLRALPGAHADVRDKIAQALAGVSREQLIRRIDELADSDVLDLKLGIAWTLGKRGDAAGVRVLTRFIRDREPRLRASAAGALGKIACAEAVAALLEAVQDRDPKARAAVVNALGKIAVGDEGARAALELRLHDPDDFVRNRAIIALARVAGARAAALISAPEVVHLVDDSAFVVALAVAGTDETLAPALTALMDPARLARVQLFVEREDPVIRAAFLQNLKLDHSSGSDLSATLNPAALVLQYEQLLRGSRDVSDRRAAIEALASIRTERSAAILAETLAADPAEPIRLRSAELLSALIDDERARVALIRAISDPSSDVAVAAIRALRGVREPAFSVALFRRLGAGSAAVKEVVEEALADVHKEDLLSFLDRAMGVERIQTLLAALRVLRRIGSPESLPLLRELLRSREPEVRAGAVRAIGQVAVAEAGPLMGNMLGDPHELVRIAALETIAFQDPGGALVRIASARADPSVTVRVRLAELLERFSGPAALRVLESLLDDVSSEVCAEALATLLSYAETDALRRFVAAFAKASADTRQRLTSTTRAESVTRKLAVLLTASSEASAREAAVGGIQALCASGHERHLLKGLFDPKPGVRLAAVRALSDVERIEIRRHLSALVHDPDSAVREAARQALQGTG